MPRTSGYRNRGKNKTLSRKELIKKYGLSSFREDDAEQAALNASKPSPDFSKSLLVGILAPTEFFPSFLVQNLLFWSFIAATLGPMISWKIK